jgi:hypothetical protein
MIRVIAFVAFCLCLAGCTPSGETAVSFYYWKTVFRLSENEKQYLTRNKVSRLYIRYFDVILKDGKAVPVSTISFSEQPEKTSIVPVVFIRNEVMLRKTPQTEDLAKKVIDLINQINSHNNISCSEIQIDCDWTLQSRDNYFHFLRLFKKLAGKTLSATIRLHQVKYHKKTGIPEVDRGVLMYYNMGRITANSLNSIYDRKTAVRYTGSLKHYPLALDIALPVFSWGIHIRNHQVIGLLSKVDEATFSADTRFENAHPFYEAKQNATSTGHYFAKGDRIKIESISTEDLEEMAGDLSDQVASKPREIIFYDLDNFNLTHFEHEKELFQKISRAF